MEPEGQLQGQEWGVFSIALPVGIYNRPSELPERGTRRPITRPRMGSFLNRFTGKNQFLFHESK